MTTIGRNELPRKRKKLYKKALGSIEYMAARITNEILFEEKGEPCRFPKIKRNPRNPRGYDVIGYW